MKLIFGTSNRGKLREASDILGPDYQVVCPADLGITEDVEETGETLEANSILKAEHIFNITHSACFADDTGLEVDALGGAPGVHSARYAGEGHDFAANRRKLLEAMKDVPDELRTARFRCVVTLILEDGRKHFFDGVVEGRIAKIEMGTMGFGYDAVFIPDEFPRYTMAELGEDIKNSISHRGMSLRLMAAWLKENVK
ncbi:MAG: RdgB/HAM1 family non-canonical purine NTP pyrophosphatase [Bacteroidales bacterium]|nr:RdgB/HAM1 family non-canonical purine NTP pyrophosphatase [Bacteroidales bacterium]